ncbi:transporter substrate-binding domain-containing protein [Sinorhizobium meliloti]|uniref:transporter substrate-binding domain-containing protein n=1 Tax=Rhizobium meliloti TaxID=382 RepID=UPI0030770752
MSNAQAASEHPGFVEGGVLKVCTAGDFPPMQYYKNPGDADLVGFEVDVVNAIAKRWGAKTEFVVGDFKGLLPSLDSKRCDLVASGIMITPARLEKYDGVPYSALTWCCSCRAPMSRPRLRKTWTERSWRSRRARHTRR